MEGFLWFKVFISREKKKSSAQGRPGQILAQNDKVKMIDMDGLLDYLWVKVFIQREQKLKKEKCLTWTACRTCWSPAGGALRCMTGGRRVSSSYRWSGWGWGWGWQGQDSLWFIQITFRITPWTDLSPFSISPHLKLDPRWRKCFRKSWFLALPIFTTDRRCSTTPR